jgi:hypothetical protein
MTAGSWRSRFGMRDRATTALGGFSLLVLALHCAFISLFLYPRIGALHFLRLHYSTAFGIDWIAEWRYILVFPLLGAAAFVANGIIAGALGEERPMFSLSMLYATALLEVAFAAAGVIAVLLNS